MYTVIKMCISCKATANIQCSHRELHLFVINITLTKNVDHIFFLIQCICYTVYIYIKWLKMVTKKQTIVCFLSPFLVILLQVQLSWKMKKSLLSEVWNFLKLAFLSGSYSMCRFSNCTLMAMNRFFSLPLKWNNHKHRSLRKMLILEENFKRHLEAFTSELFIYTVYI